MRDRDRGDSSINTGPYLETDTSRVRVTLDNDEHPVVAFEVRDGDRWRDSCTGTASLIEGMSLVAESGNADGESIAVFGTVLETPEEKVLAGTWQGRLHVLNGGWLGVEVEMNLSRSLMARPELILWLGDLVTMQERQSHTFRQTLLSGPTLNCEGLSGNDLPVLYFYDPRLRVETTVYIPASRLSWTAHRFLEYRCDLRADRATHRYGVGLVSTANSVRVVTAGRHRFVWYVRQQSRDIAPGEWQAQREMVASVEQFIAATRVPAPSWRDVAAGALQDLQDKPASQLTIEGHTGHTAYVRDTSSVREDDRRPQFLEFMTQADVVPPLALYLKLHPHPEAEAHLDTLLATLPLFHIPAWKWVGNFFPSPQSPPVEDTWYFLENALIKLPWVAAITGDEQLWDMFLNAVSGAQEMARSVNYVFPLFVDIASRSPIRAATNYSVGGLYAYGQMLAYEYSGNHVHSDEARIALATLHRLTVDRMWHEPQQLGFAAAAAAMLAEKSRDLAAETWVVDFLSAQLRMAYWDDFSTSGDALTGMFQACASLLYPAFKENVESILPWSHLLRTNLNQSATLLRLLDAQRRHNRAFFDVLGQGRNQGPGLSIPRENLGTVELPEEGRLGKELYGTGEVFWLYLLVEALAEADDPEILVCSLDLPRLSALAHFPPASRSFMTFNSTDVVRTTTIRVAMLPESDYRVEWAAKQSHETHTVNGQLEIEVSLRAGEAQRLDVIQTR